MHIKVKENKDGTFTVSKKLYLTLLVLATRHAGPYKYELIERAQIEDIKISRTDLADD